MIKFRTTFYAARRPLITLLPDLKQTGARKHVVPVYNYRFGEHPIIISQ